MDYEEVSRLCILADKKEHSELNIMDKNTSRKEFYMKSTKRKRIFAFLLCVMMLISSINVFAASTTFGYGSERADAYLSCYTSYAVGQTVPVHAGNSCSVSVDVYVGPEQLYNNSGSDSTYVTVESLYGAEITKAISSHRINSFYASLTEWT